MLGCEGPTKLERVAAGDEALPPPEPPQVAAEVVPPSKTGLYRWPEAKDERPKSEIAQDLLRLGREQYIAEQKLSDMYSVVFVLECLERRTGKRVDGDLMEWHIRRNTKAWRECRKDFQSMDPKQLETQALAWMARQDQEKQP